MKFFKFLLFGILYSIGTAAFCYPETGVILSLPLISKDPENLSGYRASLWIQPCCLIWRRLQIYFDASFAHYHAGKAANNIINAYTIAPNVRVFFNRGYVSTFLEFSVGPSYLSSTRLDTQNLGMHFAFRDTFGIGTTLGWEQRLSLSLITLHYSNGSICKHNSGITIPLLLNVSYRFL